MTGDEAATIEEVPDADEVSRVYFRIPVGMAIESEFPFTYDKIRDERAESVYWRKHAPLIADVHARGCRLEAKLGREYIGARTVVVSKIRVLETQRGHRFLVVHFPQDGDAAHAHISIERKSGPVQKLKETDRLELTHLLMQCLGNCTHDAHECAK